MLIPILGRILLHATMHYLMLSARQIAPQVHCPREQILWNTSPATPSLPQTTRQIGPSGCMKDSAGKFCLDKWTRQGEEVRSQRNPVSQKARGVSLAAHNMQQHRIPWLPVRDAGPG